jgi:putative ABC transport system substrate-binding protein
MRCNAKSQAVAIPMSPAIDPVESGFVKSFSRPGGNITGVANMYGDLTAKTLELLHTIVPTPKRSPY